MWGMQAHLRTNWDKLPPMICAQRVLNWKRAWRRQRRRRWRKCKVFNVYFDKAKRSSKNNDVDVPTHNSNSGKMMSIALQFSEYRLAADTQTQIHGNKLQLNSMYRCVCLRSFITFRCSSIEHQLNTHTADKNVWFDATLAIGSVCVERRIARVTWE